MILWGRTEKCLKETAEEISHSGTECHYFLCDVANREEVYKQAKVVREKVNQFDIFTDIFYLHIEKCNLHTVKHTIKYYPMMPLCFLCMYIGSELLCLPSGV